MQAELKKALGLGLLTLYGLGTTIGAGIYVLTGKIAGEAGIYSPLAFLTAAVLAIFSALSFAEFSSRFPKSAGEAVYVDKSWGVPSLTLVTGLVVACTGIISSAALFVSFAGHFTSIISISHEIPILLLAAFLGILAIWGIKESVSAAAVITLIEAGGLIIIITVALWKTGSAKPLPLSSPWPEFPLTGVLSGAFLAFYAMIGFEDMANVAEEVKDAPRNMPRAIILTLIFTSLLYVLVSLASILWVSPAELASADAPLSLVYERITGGNPVVISSIAFLALTNGALINIIMASRVFYGLANIQKLPPLLSRVNPRTSTPVNAILTIMVIVTGLALMLDLTNLVRITSFLALLVFALVNLSLVNYKLKNKHDKAGFNLPLAVPLTGFTVSFGFLLFEILRRI